jgi:hypothetical protein
LRSLWSVLPGVEAGEVVDEVVEGRPEVVQHVPDHRSPPRHWRLPDDFDIEEVVAGLRLEMVGDSVRAGVDVPLGFRDERGQVFLAPLELGDTAD